MHSMDPQWLQQILSWQQGSFMNQFKPENMWMKKAGTTKGITPLATQQVGKPAVATSTSDKKSLGYSQNQPTQQQKTWGGIGAVADLGSAIFQPNPETTNPLTSTLNQGYDAISNTAMAINPLVGGIMKGVGFASDALNSITGGATTIENASNTADKVLSSKFLSLTPIGMANSLSKKTVDGSAGIGEKINYGYAATDELGSTDIGGVTNMFSNIFGKKSLVGQRKNAVSRIDTQNAIKANVLNANNKNMMASTNSTQDVASKNYGKLKGGYKTNILAAKKGTKLAITRLAGEVIQDKDKNVIPSGALHARKHNLPDEIAKHVTHKGIPVISKETGGEIIQHAEIEHSEIIFTKEVTDKLESLLKDFEGGNEKAVIEAGKLLTTEILENTEDNTNLIEDV